SGNSGDSGNSGNTGNTGDTGNSGDSGNSGNTGNTGDTGNSGDSGDSGDSGNSGNTGNSGEIITPVCDSLIASDTKDPADLAKAMELCPVSIEFPYGLQSALLTFSDGTGSGDVPDGQYAVYESFGSSIVPVSGDAFLLFSTGAVADPVSNLSVNNAKTHNAPSDWYETNGNNFPASPDCKDHDPSNNPARDSVMLTLDIKAPVNAKSFSFDAYFFSADYSAYVCTQFNDFFVALLDSAYSTDTPDFQNPFDKNLAVDENGNSLGVNFVMSGLFTVCKLPDGEMTDLNKYCEGSESLAGTGYENHGATGWLKVKGNIVAGEEFKLRLALWDSADQILDSLVILDNWKWHKENIMPGTSK
ncbi:MAG TPA: choice-of-anchor L domain-containing protein, partial [bacterium]|nr:choice-of-anchor L domain-containing protein [bacterium]